MDGDVEAVMAEQCKAVLASASGVNSSGPSVGRWIQGRFCYTDVLGSGPLVPLPKFVRDLLSQS